MGTDVIMLTRLNGPEFAVNPDLIERAECTPDTVVTLVDGTKYLVVETVAELIALVREHRALIIAQASVLEAQLANAQAAHPAGTARRPELVGGDSSSSVVPLRRRES
jgi:flagellar protein FlbD